MNNIKHILLRIVTLSMLIYTISHHIYTQHKINLKLNKVLISIALFSLSAFFSTFIAVSNDKMLLSRALMGLLTLPILISIWYIALYWIRSYDDIIKGIRCLIYSGLYCSIIGIIQFVIVVITNDDSIRIKAMFSDPNIFARFLMFSIFFLFVQFIFKKFIFFSKANTLIMMTILLFMLFITYSRSGYITLFIGIIFASLFISKKTIKIGLIFTTILFSIGAFIFLLTQRFSGEGLLEPSNFNRLMHIIYGIDVIKQHWLIGIGYTNFPAYFIENYVSKTLAISLYKFEMLGYASNIHNWFVEVWSEQGIIGLISFISIFYFLFKELKIKRNSTNLAKYKLIYLGFTLMIYVFVFQGLFYHTFISQFFFWVVTSLLVASINLNTSEVKI